MILLSISITMVILVCGVVLIRTLIDDDDISALIKILVDDDDISALIKTLVDDEEDDD